MSMSNNPDFIDKGFQKWFHPLSGWPTGWREVNNLKNKANRARRQSGFPTFISCQRQDANVLPKRRQSHQGDRLCDVSTVALVARWPVFLARGSDADGGPHFQRFFSFILLVPFKHLMQPLPITWICNLKPCPVFEEFAHYFCCQMTK